MREPMLAPFVSVAAGIICAWKTPFSIPEVAFLLLALSLVSVISRTINSRKLSIISCLLSFAAAGGLVWVAHLPPPPPELTTEDRESVILSGCIVEPGFVNRQRDQFTLELEPGARARVNLYLALGQKAPDLHYGQRVEFPAVTRRIRNYRNPGDFDNVHFLARQSIYWTASVSAGTAINILPGSCGSRFMSVIYAIRTEALTRIEELYEGSAYNTAMMQATLIGESSGLEKMWTEDYRSTGTFHALVISGSHVAVLSAFLLFLLRICFVPRQWAGFATLLAAWLYTFVTGWQAPVIRSAAGMTLFIVVSFFFRTGRMLNVLAATALIFVVCDPEQLFDASFQLSFISVALIALFVIPIVERTSGPVAEGLKYLDTNRLLAPAAAQWRVEFRLLLDTIRLAIPRFPAILFTVPARTTLYFYELLLTSAVIQVGLALPMAVYFHRISFSGLSANAVVVPLLSLAVPFGFIAVLSHFAPAAQLAGGLLELSRRTVAWHARQEPAFRIPDPPLWVAIGFVCALAFAAWSWHPGRPNRNWVRIAGAVSVAIFLILLISHPFPPPLELGVLELTALDVAQGDSLLVSFPDGRLMLMDAGGIPNFGLRRKPKIDIGEDVVSPYLWSRGLNRLDIVAISHAHDDHSGGIPAILANFRPRELWVGAMPPGPAWSSIRNQAEALGIRIRYLHQGDRMPNVEVLAPLPGYEPGTAPKNNDSLVLRLTHGRHSFLLTGDVEKQIEREFVSQNLLVHSDVLKVAHHGSKTSSTVDFLDAVHPAFGLISVGYGNSYGHPTTQTLENLADRHVEILRTDEHGLISIRTDGRYLEVNYK
jgi:competence protein ComEC